jgi:hypothetical protein
MMLVMVKYLFINGVAAGCVHTGCGLQHFLHYYYYYYLFLFFLIPILFFLVCLFLSQVHGDKPSSDVENLIFLLLLIN